ncbi:hypothetical protein BHM03_00024155 [Ensete ventricosum]|nr:hypothetical protein BHM03_00024155 [Ensete ventricosum]
MPKLETFGASAFSSLAGPRRLSHSSTEASFCTRPSFPYTTIVASAPTSSGTFPTPSAVDDIFYTCSLVSTDRPNCSSISSAKVNRRQTFTVVDNTACSAPLVASAALLDDCCLCAHGLFWTMRLSLRVQSRELVEPREVLGEQTVATCVLLSCRQPITCKFLHFNCGKHLPLDSVLNRTTTLCRLNSFNRATEYSCIHLHR